MGYLTFSSSIISNYIWSHGVGNRHKNILNNFVVEIRNFVRLDDDNHGRSVENEMLEWKKNTFDDNSKACWIDIYHFEQCLFGSNFLKLIYMPWYSCMASSDWPWCDMNETIKNHCTCHFLEIFIKLFLFQDICAIDSLHFYHCAGFSFMFCTFIKEWLNKIMPWVQNFLEFVLN